MQRSASPASIISRTSSRPPSRNTNYKLFPSVDPLPSTSPVELQKANSKRIAASAQARSPSVGSSSASSHAESTSSFRRARKSSLSEVKPMSTVREMPMDSPTVPLSQAPRQMPDISTLTPNNGGTRLNIPDVSPISPEDEAQEGGQMYGTTQDHEVSDDGSALHEQLRLSQLQLGPLEFETRRGPRDTLVRGLGLSFGDSPIEEKMFPLPPSDRNSILPPVQPQKKKKKRRNPNLTIDMEKIEQGRRPPAPPPKSPRYDAIHSQPVSAMTTSKPSRYSPVSPEAAPPPVRDSPLNRPQSRLGSSHGGSTSQCSRDQDSDSAYLQEDSRPSTSGSLKSQRQGRPRKQSNFSNESRTTSKSSARSSSRYSNQDVTQGYLRADKPLPVLSPIAASIRSDHDSRSPHAPTHSRQVSENAATLTPPRSKFGIPQPESLPKKDQPKPHLDVIHRIPRKPVTPPEAELHHFPQPNSNSINQAHIPPRLDSRRGAPRVFGTATQQSTTGRHIDEKRRFASRNESQNLGQDTIEVARARMAAARLKREGTGQQQHDRPITPPTNILAPPRLPVTNDESRPATPSKDYASSSHQRFAEKLQSKSTTSVDRTTEDEKKLPLRQRAPSDVTKPLPIKRMYTNSYNAFNPYSPGLDNKQASRNMAKNISRTPDARKLNPEAWEMANAAATTSKDSLMTSTDTARLEQSENELQVGTRIEPETGSMMRTPLLAQIKSNSLARISTESKRSDKSSKKAPESPQRNPTNSLIATSTTRTSTSMELKQPMSKFNKQLPEGPSLQILEHSKEATIQDTRAPELPPKHPDTPEKVSKVVDGAEDPLKTLEGLSIQSEALHTRYADLRAERQKLTISITETIREMKAGPEYANQLLDQQLSLNAIQSSMDICFAKLKSLDCRKEEAIQKLITKTAEEVKRNSPKAARDSKSEVFSRIPIPPIPDDETKEGELTHSLSIKSVKSVKEIGAGRPVEVSRAKPAVVVTIRSRNSSDHPERRRGSNYKGSSGGSSMLVVDGDNIIESRKASSEVISEASTPEDGFRRKIRVKGAQAATILGLVAESANISPGLTRAAIAMGDNSNLKLDEPELELHIQRSSLASTTKASRNHLDEEDDDSASTEKPPSRSVTSPPSMQDNTENAGSTSASTVSTDDNSSVEHESATRWPTTAKSTVNKDALPIQTIQVLVDDDILDYYGDA